MVGMQQNGPCHSRGKKGMLTSCLTDLKQLLPFKQVKQVGEF